MHARLTATLLSLALAVCGCDAFLPSASGGDKTTHRNAPTADAMYLVQPGDTLYGIAQAAYGDGLEWPRILEANPWLDPDGLKSGHRVRIPVLEEAFTGGPQSPLRDRKTSRNFENYEATPRSRKPSSDLPSTIVPSGGVAEDPPSGNVWTNLGSELRSSQIFGRSVDKLALFGLLAAILHAAVQGFVLWIATNIAFVKDATIKKALHASFLTELLTLSTIAILGVIGLASAYSGEGFNPDEISSTVETFLRSRTGMATVGFVVLTLYALLSLRFVPQTFGIERNQAVPVVILGVLGPHLAVGYLVARNLGVL